MNMTPLQVLAAEHTVVRDIIETLHAIRAQLHGRKSLSVAFLEDFIEAVDAVTEIHHVKEMELFPFISANEDVSRKTLVDILATEHSSGHEYLSNMLRIVRRADGSKDDLFTLLPFHMQQYEKLLTQHIEKEEQDFFPLIGNALTQQQLAQAEKAFIEIEKKYNGRREWSLIAQAKKLYVS